MSFPSVKIINTKFSISYYSSDLCIFSLGANNVGNLFHMAGQVGKAVGTLVTVMTDEEGSTTEDDKH